MFQPEVSEAMAHSEGEMSQLIRTAESLQIKDTTASPPLHLRDVVNEDQHSGKDLKPQEHQSPQMYSTNITQDEPHQTCPANAKAMKGNNRASSTTRNVMATDVNARTTKADWDHRAFTMIQGEEEKRHGKEWYFFYGSLMDPRQLQRVLGLRERPRDLRPAKIKGHLTRMWGPYPVLLGGPPENVVKGVACEIERGEHKDKLALYETANYRERNCIIQFSTEEVVVGTTFEWAGDERELRDGSFDLRDWQMAHLLDD